MHLMEELMAEVDELKAFVDKVVDMRRAQKSFFKSKNFSSMQTAMVLEKEVDEMASDILRNLKDDNCEGQADLFGGCQ